ncbi:3-dehydroquinate synthase [Liquorilactobacillus sicerae]|uniref:3-dehydroquinate synthase n=1 Tax=Liquorilactobacillus sicerae TaxID=1416943 RepID=UPI00248097E6|nr:3-dehydroquinate synthase [Liquorilactobacillus sicerae]
MEQTIEVKTGQHDYAIKIIPKGLSQLGVYLSKIWSKRQIAIITDENVARIYAKQVRRQLASAGYTVQLLVVPAGEQSKSWRQLIKLIDQLAAWHFTRSDGLLALGGGVIGDLAGLVASIYLRGISIIQVPTSLLAQVDSSVGGKTAIDLTAGKNLVGTFYQPDLVLIDPTVLQTLPERLVIEGYGEVIKCAALVGGSFWQLTDEIHSVADIYKFSAELIAASVIFKVKIVMEDETETHQRQLLNLGHTLGHAVERAAAGRLFHGETVAIGLYQICRLFEKEKLTAPPTTEQVAQRLQAVGLPLTDEALATPAFYAALTHDKKIHDGRLTLIYLEKIGQPNFYPWQLEKVIAWLKTELPAIN